jgi:pyridinium-3,5-bisthiocarboxylic acid mononucleotide nickel chelatase
VAIALWEHTSTLGVRVSVLRRYELDRRTEEVRVAGRPIRVKVGLLDGRIVNVAPEHDDCAAVAAGTGRPVKQVWAEALVAATALVSSEPPA